LLLIVCGAAAACDCVASLVLREDLSDLLLTLVAIALVSGRIAIVSHVQILSSQPGRIAAALAGRNLASACGLHEGLVKVFNTNVHNAVEKADRIPLK
jgi:hypothetical protein